MLSANVHQNPEQNAIASSAPTPHSQHPPPVAAKINFPHHTKCWAFSFHKSVPRGTLFRSNVGYPYILSLIPKCEYLKKQPLLM
jgi:hypothetical protein